MSEQQLYFVKVRGRTLGPFDASRIRQMVQQGQISRINPISLDGTNWQKAGEVAQLFQTDAPRGESAEDGKRNLEPQVDNRTRNASGTSHSQRSHEPSDGVWFYNVGNQQQGPVSGGTVRELIRNGTLSGADYAWREGMPAWLTVFEIPELSAILPHRSTSTPTSGDIGSAAATDFRETKLIIGYSSGWLAFIYIFTYVAAGLNFLGAFINIVLAFREYSSLLEARSLLSQSLASAMLGAFLMVTANFLRRHGNCMNRFRHNESIEDLNQGLRWIGRYWLLYGICLIIALFLAAVGAIVAVAVPGFSFF